MSKYIVREGMKQYKKNGLVVTEAPLFYGEASKGEGALAKVQKFLKDHQMLLILLGLGGLAAYLFRDKLGLAKKKKNPTRRRRRRNPHCYDQNPKKRRNTKKRKNTAKKRNPTRKRRNTSTKRRKNTTKRRNKASKAQLAARKRFVNKFAKRKNSRRRSRK